MARWRNEGAHHSVVIFWMTQRIAAGFQLGSVHAAPTLNSVWLLIVTFWRHSVKFLSWRRRSEDGALGAALLRSGSPSSSLPCCPGDDPERCRLAGLFGTGGTSQFALWGEPCYVRWAKEKTTTPFCTEVQMGQSAGICAEFRCSSQGLPESSLGGKFLDISSSEKWWQKVSEGSEISQHWRGSRFAAWKSSSQKGFIRAVLFFP